MAAPAVAPDSVKPRARNAVRADIQALRALAVALVVIYHFFPGTLRGGFVGVDVFFVISGFLITQHLVTSTPRGWGDLTRFWGRRVRRLLPASFLVLAVTLVATLLIAPSTVWENTARQIAASALYVQNWFLAVEAVDYLAVDNAASPVQHFWSLSIEEQFYLVWPVLVLIAAAIAVRMRRSVAGAIAVVGGVVFVASLVASVMLTASDPASAYFVTWTRAWELAAGALAACAYGAVHRMLGERTLVRSLMAWVGLAAIAVSAVAYSSATPFPGVAALVPVLGTVLVLVATVRPGVHSPLRAMSLRPVQYLGDISYSLYLWHWPVVVLLPYALGDDPSRWVKVAAILAVVGLAALTKVFVEDRLRGSRPLGIPLRRSFVFAVAGMVVIAGASVAVVYQQSRVQLSESETIAAALQQEQPCFGGMALLTPECDSQESPLLTSPEFAAADQPDPYNDDCWVLAPYDGRSTCQYGSTDPDATRVALVGNSHAGHWLPALQEIAERRNWSITTYLISVCYPADVPLGLREPESENCAGWNEFMTEDVAAQDFDLVVMSAATNTPIQGYSMEESDPPAQESYGRVIDRWSETGTPVLVIRDTPYATDLENVPDCVAENLDNLSACDGTLDRIEPDPLANAASERSDGVDVVDLNAAMCRDDTCFSVVGGVIVYFDRGHLSATFAASLWRPIEQAALPLLAARE